MMRVVLFLWALSLPALAATGTSAAENWFVRPAADCANNGDGLAYNCAASAGASGAFSGLAGVSWTTTTGLDDGDTLYVCGSFTAADKDFTTAMILVSGIGTASAPITLQGDCSSYGGPAKAALDGAGDTAITYGILWETTDAYVYARNFRVGNVQTNGYQLAATANNAVIDSEVFGTMLTGVALYGTGHVVDNMLVPAGVVQWDAIASVDSMISATIRNSELHSAATPASDTIEIPGLSTTSMTIENNLLVHHHEDKGTLTIKRGAGLYVIRDNVFDGADTNGYGLSTEGTFEGDLIVQRNVFRNYVGDQANPIQLDGNTTAASPSALIVGNVFIGGYDLMGTGDYWTVQAYHNTMLNPERYAFYSGGTSGVGPAFVDIRNNVMSASTQFLNSWGYEVTLILDGNAYIGSGIHRINNTVYADLAAVQAATAYEDNGIAPASAQWHGGESPTDYAQFRPRRTSPLCGVGVKALTGVTRNGKRLGAAPDIGAFQCWSFPQ